MNPDTTSRPTGTVQTSVSVSATAKEIETLGPQRAKAFLQGIAQIMTVQSK